MLFLIQVPEQYRRASGSENCFGIIHEFDEESVEDAGKCAEAWITDEGCTAPEYHLLACANVARFIKSGAVLSVSN